MEIETVINLECVCKNGFSYKTNAGMFLTYETGQRVNCEFGETGVTVRSRNGLPIEIKMSRKVWDGVFETTNIADEIRSRLVETTIQNKNP